MNIGKRLQIKASHPDRISRGNDLNKIEAIGPQPFVVSLHSLEAGRSSMDSKPMFVEEVPFWNCLMVEIDPNILISKCDCEGKSFITPVTSNSNYPALPVSVIYRSDPQHQNTWLLWFL